MPLSKHFGGQGAKVMRDMKSRYGEKHGEEVFYATENKRKSQKKAKRQAILDYMKKER